MFLKPFLRQLTGGSILFFKPRINNGLEEGRLLAVELRNHFLLQQLQSAEVTARRLESIIVISIQGLWKRKMGGKKGKKMSAMPNEF